MKKYIICLIFLLIFFAIAFFLLSKSDVGVKEFKKAFKENLSKGITSEELYNNYGGFHYEGKALYRFSFTNEQATAFINKIQKNKEWNILPMEESIDLAMYGGVKENRSYGCKFADEVGLPKINNGYWRFVNRNNYNDLLNSYSFNFTLAIFDADNNVMYLFKIDT